GAGKSTLTDRLITLIRGGADEVGVLAVDPSSPFTGGAFLGDRVRMQEHALDGGVFIRSMATRGHLGGLALATPEAIRALDAAGLERDLSAALDMNMHMGEWRPPIVRTVASTGEGVEDAWAAVTDHRAYLERSGELDRRRGQRLRDELREIVLHRLEQVAYA